MTQETAVDLFVKIDELVYRLEDEGYPFGAIIDELTAYVEIVKEYQL